MDRAEKGGLAIAAAGHVALFALLSLGLFQARVPKPPVAETMDVTIADAVGPKPAAPAIAREAPAASEAPEQGAPLDAAPPPPAPEPTPAPPEPQPAPPKLAPPKPSPSKPARPKPTPPKPTPPKPTPPKPEPKPLPPEPKPVPKPEPKPKPAPKSVPDNPKPTPEKPRPEQVKPAKPTAEQAKPGKPAPDARSTSAKPAPAKKAPGLPSDFLKDLPKDAGTGRAGAGEKAKGSHIGKDFLKGLAPDAPGKAAGAQVAAVSAQSLAGIGALIKQQVKPNYNPPTGGADAAAIKSTLQITMSRDGTVRDVQVVGHQGVNSTNSAYVKQADDAAVRAVKRSSPLRLPPDLYDGGWQNITLNFSGAQLQ